MNYAYTFFFFFFFALSALIFIVLNLPIPIGRLTPAASSIFNIVSSVTLLSPWGAGVLCVCQEGVSVRHTTFCFLLFFGFFFFFFFFNVLIKPILMGTAKQQYSVGQIYTSYILCLQIETKEFCIVQKNEWKFCTVQKNESQIPTIAIVVVNCQIQQK